MDFSDDITTALTGLTAAVTAAVGVAFGLALGIKAIRIAAGYALKVTGLVKKG